MAGQFGVDLGAVEEVRGAVSAIRSDLGGIQPAQAADTAVTGSPAVTDALHRFVDDSSDQRRRLVELLDAVLARLDALVQGTRMVDQILVNSVATFDGAGDSGD
ncbi:MAG: hypothetical protein IPJ14_14915 [Kineosporiaceae bacterium]|nr:hypothetical protein [Kineosporiaceae bacterium]